MSFPSSEWLDTNFWLAAAISLAMICLTTTIHYEYLRLVSVLIEGKKRHRPRWVINIIVISQFFVHTISVWAYGILYWILANHSSLGALEGFHDDSFLEYIYFSASTYSSLGFGDVFPIGSFRLIAGVEVLNGLLLIGWSVTFTYFSMQRMWEFHGEIDEK
jgi:Ion channel